MNTVAEGYTSKGIVDKRRKPRIETEDERERRLHIQNFSRSKAAEFRENLAVNGARFGKWLSEQREKAGISQTELAKRTFLHQPTISRLESGDIAVPRPESLAVISWALGLSEFEVLTRAGFAINTKWTFKDMAGRVWNITKPLGDPTQPIDGKTADLLAVLGFIEPGVDEVTNAILPYDENAEATT